jgi:hypothetical protein
VVSSTQLESYVIPVPFPLANDKKEDEGTIDSTKVRQIAKKPMTNQIRIENEHIFSII